jgi:hypothetical protein
MTNLQDIKVEIQGIDVALDQIDTLKATLVIKRDRLLAQASDIEAVVDAIKGPLGLLKGVN